MGGHPGGADQHAKAVLTGVFSELRRSGGGAVGAEDVGLVGDGELLQLPAGPLDHGPIAVGAHDDGDFFHKSTPFVKKFQAI